MSARVIGVVAVFGLLLASPQRVDAQEPFNLAVPVEHAATLFTNLFGPRGLVVDSEATLPGEQSHSAHFNSDFQGNFSQFGTALVSQIVTVPLVVGRGRTLFESVTTRPRLKLTKSRSFQNGNVVSWYSL